MSAVDMAALRSGLGQTDIYLVDQILKGRFTPGAAVLDVGCGGGRNLRWFLDNDFEVWAVDADASALAGLQALLRELRVQLPEERQRVASLPDLPFGDARFDVVLCIAVLHFASDQAALRDMVAEVWRVLKPNGVLLVRTASQHGLLPPARQLDNGRFALPDGTERTLVSEPMLRQLSEELGGRLLEPIKTTIVHGARCMTTWCVAKGETT